MCRPRVNNAEETQCKCKPCSKLYSGLGQAEYVVSSDSVGNEQYKYCTYVKIVITNRLQMVLVCYFLIHREFIFKKHNYHYVR